MRQEEITFRRLLEQVLPLDDLLPPERLKVETALQQGLSGQLQEAALFALERLEERGALHRLPAGVQDDSVVRYEPREGFSVISVRFPTPIEEDGVLSFARAMLPSRAQASLEQIRRLLRLDEPLLSEELREGRGRTKLLFELNAAGRELIGDAEFRFYLDGGEEETDAPLDDSLARAVRERPGFILYSPDAWASRRLELEARRRDVRSLALVGLAGSEGGSLGHLEVRSRKPQHLSPQDLAMIALLADHCAAILERAERIERLMFVDPLTGAYNRSYFDLQVQNEVARSQREHASFALCIVDIDDFKAFNTAYGYHAGNEVLTRVAKALRREVRPFDTVARWGGEEFAVLLTSPVQREDAGAICERLRRAVEQLPLRLEGLDRRAHHASVTISMGVALHPDHADNSQELWRAANRALLEAKHPPKNRIVFFGFPQSEAG